MDKDERGIYRARQDSSPQGTRYSTLRDKHNRPFKALTPKRLEKDSHHDHENIPSPFLSPTCAACGNNGACSRSPSPGRSMLKPDTNITYKTSHSRSSSPAGPSCGGRLLNNRDQQPENKLPPIRTCGSPSPSRFLHNYDEDEDDAPDSPESAKKKSKTQLINFIQKNEFGADVTFKSPFGINKVTYLDYTASGRPLKCIEAYIQRYVLPTYANTHTEVSHDAIQTTIFREEARDIIRKSVNAGEDDCVIFTGSGVTTAINKLVHNLNIDRMESVIVFIGPYEHHSNILPWIHTKAQVIRIPQDREGLLDINTLAYKLEQVSRPAKRGCTSRAPFIIGAFSAASNVTGILTDVDTISSLIHLYDGIVVWDYACAGPYVKIDMNPPNTGANGSGEPYKDAVFISPHKFVGGPGTPGLLIAKKWIFQNEVPHGTGGGTVLFVRRTKHVYITNPEAREEGGTPAIIESIRCGLVFKLKETIGVRHIMKREHTMIKKAVAYLNNVDGLVLLGNPNVNRLAIMPFLFYNSCTGRFLHHDFVATVFNEVFGIQVRSGCACAGPYGMDLMGMSEDHAEIFEKLLTVREEDNVRKPSDKFLSRDNVVFQNAIFKPGFVRLNLPFIMSDNCFDFVLKAVRLMALHGWSLLPQYRCDVEKGGWTHVGAKGSHSSRRHLDEVSFESNGMTVKKPVVKGRGCHVNGSSSDSSESPDVPPVTYSSILKRAEGLFHDAMSGLYDCKKEEAVGVSDEMMWFMTPKDAADIIHKRKTKEKLRPEQLPFMPGGLAVKLGINPQGHPARGNLDKNFVMEYHHYRDPRCRDNS